jgi:hypothetical protein
MVNFRLRTALDSNTSAQRAANVIPWASKGEIAHTGDDAVTRDREKGGADGRR